MIITGKDLLESGFFESDNFYVYSEKHIYISKKRVTDGFTLFDLINEIGVL